MKKIFIITFITVLLSAGFNLYAGSKKHFIKDPINGNKEISNPSNDYKLHQNFPNPFNPVTKISYRINKEGYVTLKVYNLVGQTIEVLVNENQKPGTYEYEFDGTELTSGVYLYQLQINDFISVKRMTLLK
jgi:hypothetical protein